MPSIYSESQMSSILSNTIASIWQLVSISFSIRKRKLHITIAEKVCIDQQKEKKRYIGRGMANDIRVSLEALCVLMLIRRPERRSAPPPSS